MSELRPYLTEGTDPLGRQLFREARSLGPSQEAVGRAMTAIVSAAAGSTGASSAAAASATKAGFSASTPALFAKWLIAGFLGGAITVGVAHRLVDGSAPADSGAALPPPEPALGVDQRAQSRAVARNPDEVGEGASSTSSGEPSRVQPARGHAEPRAAGAGGGTGLENDATIGLAQEVRLIDQARSALERGEPQRALSVLDEYRRKAPAGRLAPEASYLRVKALFESGNRTAAERAGREFLESRPSSPHAKQVRGLLAPTPATKNP